MRVLAGLLVFAAVVFPIEADAKKLKKYYFELAEVTGETSQVAGMATTVANATGGVGTEAKAAFANHPQIVAELASAPDPKIGVTAFRKYLTKKGVSGAYRVNIEIAEASEETEDAHRPGELRLVVRLSLRMFGETIPDRSMAFTGNGSATIKLEVGKKVRPRDREVAWQEAAKGALGEAINESLTKLGQPPAKPTKKK